jgi:hypothetical protein
LALVANANARRTPAIGRRTCSNDGGTPDDHGWIEEEEAMALVGLAITFLGFLVAVGSLGISNSNTVRGGIVLVGIAVSLVGIMGVLNQAYLKDAIWKK